MQWGQFHWWLMIGILSLCGLTAFSQEAESFSEEAMLESPDDQTMVESAVGSKILLVIAKPDFVGIKSGEANWIASFSEEYLHFRLGAVGQIRIVNSDTLAALISATGASDILKYYNVAKRLDATHLLYTEFKQGAGKKAVHLSLSLMSVHNEKTDTFSVNGTTETIHEGLDQGILKMLLGDEFSVEQRERKFLGTGILGQGSNAKTIGASLAEGKAHLKVAENLKNLATGNPPCLVAFFVGAREYVKASRYEDAARLLRDLTMKIGPNYPLLYPLAARYYRLGDNNEEALQMINIAQGMNLATDELLIEKAMVYEGLEEWKKAEAAYAEVLKLDPSNFRGLLFFIKKYNQENRPSEALDMANRFVPIFPNNGTGHLEMGKSLIALNRYDEAKESLGKAAGILTKEGTIPLMLGDLYARDKDLARALEYYFDAVELMPENAEPYIKAAHIQTAQGNPQAALDILKQKEKQFYDNPLAQKEMGIARYRLGDAAAAKRNLNRSLEGSAAPDTEVLLALGELYEKDGDLRQSLDMYTRLRSIDPTNTDAANRIAELKAKLEARGADAPKHGGSEYDDGGEKRGPRISARLTFQIASGVLMAGSIAGGYLLDSKIKDQSAAYTKSQNVAEVDRLHKEIQQNSLYRNVLYSAGMLLAAGFGITFFF